MSTASSHRAIISPEHLPLLQSNAAGSELGWNYYSGLVPDRDALSELHQESLHAQRLQPRPIVPRSKGIVSISYIENKNLKELPATNRFIEELGAAVGSRILSAQYNFYEPGSELLAHSDGPNKEPEASAVLSVAGEGEFDILFDPVLGYTDVNHMTVKPGDGVILPPIMARDHKMYTSRRHSVANKAGIQRVALVVAYIVPV